MTTDTPVNEAAGGEQLLDGVDAAISTLEVALNVVETNEPINRAEGNQAQADLEAANAASFREAIAQLRAGVRLDSVGVAGLREHFQFATSTLDRLAIAKAILAERTADAATAAAAAVDAPPPAAESAPNPPVVRLDEAGDQRAQDMELLTAVANGTHPDMLEPELALQVEAALQRHQGDEEVKAMADRAILAYSNGSTAAMT